MNEIRIDRPLQTGTALETDTLERRSFALRVTEVLRRISPEAGLVVSIEGAWGCGKTSLLAMVEDLLRSAHARAAWRAIVEGKAFYGKDGTYVER